MENRTLKLHAETARHLSDVHLFVNLLSGFSRMQNTVQLISSVIESVGKRFHAAQVVYYCTIASENHYSWKKEASVKTLDKKIHELLWKDEVLFEDNHLYVPIKSPESLWGILCISWTSPPDPQDLDPAVLLALGHQMAILIENIQAFSNIRFQNDMLESVFEVFKAQGTSKRVSISFDLENNLPDIKCDAAILEQILTTLWLNAFDALNDENGRIHISTRLSSQKQVKFCIEDNGQGIPEEVIPQIFHPFYTTKDIGKGTGLGLSVVYGFINELGGRIDVKSDDKTMFCISFLSTEE